MEKFGASIWSYAHMKYFVQFEYNVKRSNEESRLSL